MISALLHSKPIKKIYHYFTSHMSPRYLNLLKEHARYPTECNIVALIYTNRMTSMGSMPLTMRNWRAVWVISIILAQKMWDDRPLRSSAFAIILPSFSKQLLRDLELKALSLLQFSSGNQTKIIVTIGIFF